MNKLAICIAAMLLFCLKGYAFCPSSTLGFSEVLLEVNTPSGEMIVYRPNQEEMERELSRAKAIFIEAFSTTYTEYHRKSGSSQPIESWLRLRPGLTLQSWLGLVFDEEYDEFLKGTKGFVYVADKEGVLRAWLSYSPLSEKGDLYLSQCSLEADFRNQKVATSVFAKALNRDVIKSLYPGVKNVKLIARKINTIAHRLYTKAGFIVDETIDPAVYGDSYDDRYVGFRLSVE